MSCLKYKPNHHITGVKVKPCILRWRTFWSTKQAELDTYPISRSFTWQPGRAEKNNDPKQGFQWCCFSVILTKLSSSACFKIYCQSTSSEKKPAGSRLAPKKPELHKPKDHEIWDCPPGLHRHAELIPNYGTISANLY